MLLLKAGVVKGPVFDDRAAQCEPGAVFVQVWFVPLILERIAGTHSAILKENENVAVKRVGPRFGHNVDGASRSTSGLG
jgi:hypothetical protein